MNYFELHIGDYAQATAHLSILEDGVYLRLMRRYYADEQALPLDVKAVQRLVGARTAAEKTAVKDVLEEFFVRAEDGWHNKRCDEEIARFQDKQAKARGSANARWSKRQPQSEGSADGMRTHQNKDANALPPQSEGNALQSPVSSLQSPQREEGRIPPTPLAMRSHPEDPPEPNPGNPPLLQTLTQEQIRQIKAEYPPGRYAGTRWLEAERNLQTHAGRGVAFGLLLAGTQRYADWWRHEGGKEASTFSPVKFFDLENPMFERAWTAPGSTTKPRRRPAPTSAELAELEAQGKTWSQT